jgi:FtsZ-binding cell division protein ZapB
MAKATTVGIEPIDRLEEKIKLLVQTITRLKNEQSRLSDDNSRLQREVEVLQGRLAEAEGHGVEVASLREEREVIRTRVTEMLSQLDSLSL